MISIAMPYINRRKLLIETLKSITRSEYKDYEVIIVDDASEENERIEDLVEYFPFLQVIRVEKEEKWYVSGCMPWNRAIANCKGDIIIIQNPECLHVHDILSYVAKNINDTNYISISVYSIDEQYTKDLPLINNLLDFFNTLPQQQVIEYIGWYNHSKYNEKYYPFCAALTMKNMDELGGFDERYAAGVGFEDNDLINRITRMGLNKIIADDVSVIHQWHPKVWNLSDNRDGAYWHINSFGYKIAESETHWSIKNSYKMNPYYTHQKYLTEELNKLDYSKPVIVLEFGTGDGSASVLQSFALNYPNLKIESYDDSRSWHSSMKAKYCHPNYNFNYAGSWDDLFLDSDILHFDYDLVFVDAGPDFDARIKIINYIKNNAKVIILHDYDFYNKGIMEDHYCVGEGSFFGERYSKEFILQGNSEYPGTLVMRNKKWNTI